jgi:hypothetical protein
MILQSIDHNSLLSRFRFDLICPECKLVCTILACSDILVCESRHPSPVSGFGAHPRFRRQRINFSSLTLIRNSACIHFLPSTTDKESLAGPFSSPSQR